MKGEMGGWKEQRMDGKRVRRYERSTDVQRARTEGMKDGRSQREGRKEIRKEGGADGRRNGRAKRREETERIDGRREGGNDAETD